MENGKQIPYSLCPLTNRFYQSKIEPFGHHNYPHKNIPFQMKINLPFLYYSLLSLLLVKIRKYNTLVLIQQFLPGLFWKGASSVMKVVQ